MVNKGVFSCSKWILAGTKPCWAMAPRQLGFVQNNREKLSAQAILVKRIEFPTPIYFQNVILLRFFTHKHH